MQGEVLDNVIRVNFGRVSEVNEAPADEAKIPADPASIQKLKMFSDWIEEGMVMIGLDARREGVQVPPHLAGDCELRLNFSLRFDLRDFAYDEQGVSATLMFPQGLFFCMLPWTSVFAMHSHANNTGVMWPEAIPEEMDVDVKAGTLRMTDSPKKSDKSTSGKLLTFVPRENQ